MEGEPLDEVQWRSPEWIQRFGLRTDNVLDYFSQSPFFDRSSNNQVLKMQSQFNELGQAQHRNPAEFYNELRNMRGVEFVVAISREPDLWVIRKQNRLSPQETRPLATYFVIGENIYMAPSVYSVVTSRLLSTTLNLNKALTKARALPGFSPSQGYFYKNENNPIAFAGSSSNNNSSSSNTGTPAAAATGTTTTNTPRPGLRSVAATPLNTGTPRGGGGAGAGAGAGGAGGSGAGALSSSLPQTAAAEWQAYMSVDRALKYALSSTSTVYIDDATPASSASGLTAAAAAAAASAGGGGGGSGAGVPGSTASSVVVGAGAGAGAGPPGATSAAAGLSSSPSTTDLKAKAALNNQVAAKRRRKPLR